VTDVRASLQPGDYVDPGVYAQEVDRVLCRSWLPVCRVDQIPSAGDRIALTLAGRPVVAVRDGSGEVRVLANVCAHRGSKLVDDGRGHSSTLICPYHRWAFRLDGSFIGAPLADGGDLTGACLPALRHTIWEGFVLVDLSGDAPGPAEQLRGLSEQLAPWRWAELVTVGSRQFESTWNWKVMVENWIECYHHIGSHRDTVESFQPAHTTRIVANDGAPWVAMTVDSVGGIAGEPETWIPGMPEERSRDLSVWSAFPILLGGSVSRYAFWLHVVPIEPGRHTVTWYLLAHPDRLERFTPDVVEEHMEMFATVHREDMEACQRVQAGLASGLLDRFRITPLEAPIADFQRWVRVRLSA
jgi:phenylpropionate dioxygenase-like ring-hydroxylating dioxygenase large terminal subunit